MGDWGEYKNNSIPTNRTNEETEARRLHYLCQDREINLSKTRIFPLTFRGEASEEFWVMWGIKALGSTPSFPLWKNGESSKYRT